MIYSKRNISKQLVPDGAFPSIGHECTDILSPNSAAVSLAKREAIAKALALRWRMIGNTTHWIITPDRSTIMIRRDRSVSIGGLAARIHGKGRGLELHGLFARRRLQRTRERHTRGGAPDSASNERVENFRKLHRCRKATVCWKRLRAMGF